MSEDICLFGKTVKKDEYVKIEEIALDKINSICPDIDITNSKEITTKWQLEDDHYFYIDLSQNSSVIEPYLAVLKSSGSYNVIDKNKFSKLEGIFFGNNIGEEIFDIKFQRIYSRYFFKKPFFSFNDECKLEDAKNIIMLNNQTDAYYAGKEQKLYFKNFKHIKPLFNGIGDLYREASKEDIEKFKKIEILDVEDNKLGERARKKIAEMLDSEVFKSKTLDGLNDYAKKYNEVLPIENGKINIKENKDIDLLYKVVNELFYTSEISNEKRETNSVVKIKEKTNNE